MSCIRQLGAVLLTLLALTACDKEAKNAERGGAFVSREIVWSSAYIDGDGPINSGMSNGNLVVGDRVLANGGSPAGAQLMAFNVDNGHRLWTWSDLYPGPDGTTEFIGIHLDEFPVRDSRLVYTYGSKQYAIDLTTGETLWKVNLGAYPSFGGSEILQHGDHWYKEACSASITELCAATLHRGAFDKAIAEEVVVTPIPLDSSRNGRSVDITSYEWLPGSEGRLVAIVYQHAVEGIRYDDEFVSYLGLYDLDAAQWVYSGVKLHEVQANGVALAPAKAVGDRIYISIAETMMCYDIPSGEKIWSRKLPREIWTSGFAIDDSVCAVNCEDKVMYGLDADTGAELWTVETAQRCSPLRGRVLEGVAYFVCGSDHSLFGVDLREGKLIWKLDAEEMIKGAGGFAKHVSAAQGHDGEPGKLFVRAAGEVHCIEAHR